MNTTTRRFIPAFAIVAVVALSAGTGSAVAGKMITGSDIKNNTVTTSDIKNGTLKGKDVKAKSLAESKLSGSVKTKLNAPSVKGYEVVSTTTPITIGSIETAYANCSAGKIALSGSGEWADNTANVFVLGDGPRNFLPESSLYAPATSGDSDSWAVDASNQTLDTQNFTVTVICVNPS